MARKASKPNPHKRSRVAEVRSDVRLTAGINPAVREANIRQLRRARGQVDGIERMLEQDRYCADIIIQITAARASLQVVANALLEAHLKACHELAASNGGFEADQMYQELLMLVAKMAK